MTLFLPRFNDFSTVFRLADELDRASCRPRQRYYRAFAPRFDVKETKETYELTGELPGIDAKDVNIEWRDEHTLSISGRSESRHEESSETPEKVAEPQEERPESPVSEDSETYHSPTVEDEAVEGAAETEKAAEAEAAKPAETPKAANKPTSRYWVSERSTGSFQRTFTFSGRVDRDAVTASLKNGVLSISVPKAKALEPKKITIN